MYHAMRLGRIDAPLPDGLPTLDQHPIATAVAPYRVIRDDVKFQPTMGANDQYGDCTCVALANAIHAEAALSGWDVNIPDQPIIDLYSKVSGFTPGNPDTDHGAYEIDVLTYQSRHGFNIGDQVPYVGLWANIPKDNLNLVRLVVSRMGTAYLGLNLALADQHGGGVWDVNTPSWEGDPAPGSWGGHAALIWAYNGVADDDILQIVTWGSLQKATWRWLESRISECHVVYHPQMLSPTGKNPAGFDRERLAADVASFVAVA